MIFTRVENTILKFISFFLSSKNLHCAVLMSISIAESPVDGSSYFMLRPNCLKRVVWMVRRILCYVQIA